MSFLTIKNGVCKMADNFLRVSNSFTKSLRKEGEKDAFLRYDIVAKHLDEKYFLTEDKKSGLIAELQSEGCMLSSSTVKWIAEMLRLPYRYFNEGGEAISKRILNKKDPATRGVRCLVKDGFESWEQIINQPEKIKHPENKESLNDTELQEEKLRSSDTKDLSSEVAAVAGKTVSPDYAEDFDSVLTSLLSEWKKKMQDKIDELKDELKKAEEKNASLEITTEKTAKENISLRAIINRQQEEIEEKDEELTILRSIKTINGEKDCTIERLQYSLGEAVAETDFLGMELAEQESTIIKLKEFVDSSKYSLELINQIHEQIEVFAPVSRPGSHAQEEGFDNDPTILLPQECVRFGRPFLYSNGFEKTFKKMSRAEQLLIVKQLELLSKHGPEYASLRTNKQFHETNKIGKGESKSRGGKFFRFTWNIKNEEVQIISLFRKKELL